jgi:dTDP-4-amino-4,6-dideoxygalactose transaminase
MGMNRKAISSAAIALGVLLLAIGVYQTNQYLVSSATASATVESFGQLGVDATGGVDYAAQLNTSLSKVSGALTQAIFIDYALGLVFLLAGLMAYPDK